MESYGGDIETFDAAIIGAGQAGSPLARALAKAGWKTVIIERKDIGGTCVNVGCTPTKTMIASAKVAYLMRQAAEFGLPAPVFNVDMKKIVNRKRTLVESFRTGDKERLLRTANLTLLEGKARFIAMHTLAVKMKDGSDKVVEAEKIFINTGARASIPNFPGLNEIVFFDSTSIMELQEVPEHLIILGGGPIGIEFGQMFQRFGSIVTIVQRNSQLLPKEDADIAEEVKKIMEEDGIRILLNAEIRQIAQEKDGSILVKFITPTGDGELKGSHLMIAIGRVPETDDLNLSAAGISKDEKGFIKVNERLETGSAGVYALGEVTGEPAFTHISYDDYRIIQANLLNGGDRTTTDRILPYTIYIDPQLGRVGLTEKEAIAKNCNLKIAKMPMSYVARALEINEARGVIKVVVDANNGQILGCAVLGVEGGELMSLLQVAMMGKIHYSILRDAIFAHPTLAESLNNLFFYLK